MTSFILMLIIAAIILNCIKYSMGSCITLFMLLICYLLIGDGVIPAILLNNLQVPFVSFEQTTWKNSNAIILLGDGTVKLPNSQVVPTMMAFSRINQIASLYRNCIKNSNKCTVIISGGDALHTGISEATVYSHELQALGVKNTDIRLESHSMNTFENAKFTSAILKRDAYEQTFLVTSGIHLRRALLYFSYFGIIAKPVSADYLASQVSFIPTGYNFVVTDFVIHEYIGIMRFYIYNFFGWNVKPPS